MVCDRPTQWDWMSKSELACQPLSLSYLWLAQHEFGSDSARRDV